MFVMACLMMFAEIISKMFEARVSHNHKMACVNLIAGPKIPHFHRTRTLALDGAICNTHRRQVVDVNRQRGLRMAQLLEREPNHARLLHVEEERAKLSLCGGRGNAAQDGTDDEDGAVEAMGCP